MDRHELSKESNKHGFLEFWVEREGLEAPPQRKTVPYCWRWSNVYPLLREAAKIVPLEEAHRRGFLLANPGMHPRPFISSTLLGAYSLYNPGEIATVHRHTPSATRFVLMGDGGFTTVQGEKCSMSRGDVVLTPNGTWHNHGNDGTEPVIWFDVLDLPLAEACNGSDFEFDYKEPVSQTNAKELVERQYQTVTAPLDYSSKLYATGGILPRFLPHNRGRGFGSPQYVYRWKDTVSRLQELKEFEGDPRDGIVVEYVDPTTGSSALPTLSLRVQLLRASSMPEWQRNTSNTMFCVFQGQGRTEFEGTSLEWEQNDVFVAPSGYWYRNINVTNDDLILYSVSDSPALEKLGFLRSQGRNKGGEIAELTPNYSGFQK